MKRVLGLGALALTLLAGCSSLPGVGKGVDDRHPPGAAAVAPAPDGYDQQMSMMQDMHQKMAAAKTPEEHAALMKDHMKTMQGGIGMMGHMRGGMMGGAMGMDGGKGTMPMDPGTMKRRMDMMEMMMQMMIDREGMKPAAPK